MTLGILAGPGAFEVEEGVEVGLGSEVDSFFGIIGIFAKKCSDTPVHPFSRRNPSPARLPYHP
jgi:hypothetical protein